MLLTYIQSVQPDEEYVSNDEDEEGRACQISELTKMIIKDEDVKKKAELRLLFPTQIPTGNGFLLWHPTANSIINYFTVLRDDNIEKPSKTNTAKIPQK